MAKNEKHLEIYEGLKEDNGMKTHLRSPMDYTKNLKLRFPVVRKRKTWLQIFAHVVQHKRN